MGAEPAVGGVPVGTAGLAATAVNSTTATVLSAAPGAMTSVISRTFVLPSPATMTRSPSTASNIERAVGRIIDAGRVGIGIRVIKKAITIGLRYGLRRIGVQGSVAP